MLSRTPSDQWPDDSGGCKWPHGPGVHHNRHPRSAASIAAMSTFSVSIMASNARLAAAGSRSATAAVRMRGVICHDGHHSSLHHPQAQVWPPYPTMAFHSQSVSAWVSVASWNENVSLRVKAGPRNSRRAPEVRRPRHLEVGASGTCSAALFAELPKTPSPRLRPQHQIYPWPSTHRSTVPG